MNAVLRYHAGHLLLKRRYEFPVDVILDFKGHFAGETPESLAEYAGAVAEIENEQVVAARIKGLQGFIFQTRVQRGFTGQSLAVILFVPTVFELFFGPIQNFTNFLGKRCDIEWFLDESVAASLHDCISLAIDCISA